MTVDTATPRRLWALVANLPDDAALWRAYREWAERPANRITRDPRAIADWLETVTR